MKILEIPLIIIIKFIQLILFTMAVIVGLIFYMTLGWFIK